MGKVGTRCPCPILILDAEGGLLGDGDTFVPLPNRPRVRYLSDLLLAFCRDEPSMRDKNRPLEGAGDVLDEEFELVFARVADEVKTAALDESDDRVVLVE